MASTTYYVKIRESDSSVVYAYGADAAAMISELILDKERRQPAMGADSLSYTGRRAAGKIVQRYLEQGEWPEKGVGVS